MGVDGAARGDVAASCAIRGWLLWSEHLAADRAGEAEVLHRRGALPVEVWSSAAREMAKREEGRPGSFGLCPREHPPLPGVGREGTGGRRAGLGASVDGCCEQPPLPGVGVGGHRRDGNRA
jgi:hypothetical protein